MPNVFDPVPFTFDPVRRAAKRAELGLTPSTTAIIHVARIGAAKNHVFDIEIMRELAVRGTDAVLLLSGDGPLRADLADRVHRAGLDDTVRFLGARSDIPDLMQAADVSILPSTFEGLPYTALEAQAAGVPLILSDVVSADVDLADTVTRLDLADGPEPWADVIAAIDPADTAGRAVNPIVGSPFDLAGAGELFARLLRADQRA